jgi:hypothetical protein
MFWCRRRWRPPTGHSPALGHGLYPVTVATWTTAARKGIQVLLEAGQVAVVTGAAQGLGRALAAGLIDCGVSVVLADTATESLQTTAEEFTARGARVLSVITDVSDAVAVDALASRTLPMVSSRPLPRPAASPRGPAPGAEWTGR